MTRLIWDEIGARYFEAGIDRGVFYKPDGDGYAWNGLIAVKESPSGGQPTPYYIDGIKYLNVPKPEDFNATIEAFTYPDEFDEFDGTSYDELGIGYTLQPRKPFNLTYRSKVGNDLLGSDYAYKLHLIYNALAEPSARSFSTIDNSPGAMPFSWNISAMPIMIPGRTPTPHLVLDSRKVDPYRLAEVENILYGSAYASPRFPSLDEMITVFGWEMFRIIPDHEDGLATLIDEGRPDLKDNNTLQPGLYRSSAVTRLNETNISGLYQREE